MTRIQEEPEEPQEPPSPVRPAPLPKKRTIEEALEAGGWEFKRGKHHIVFERHVVAPGGRKKKQTFVAASIVVCSSESSDAPRAWEGKG